MTAFHSDDYIEFLRTITPENTARFLTQLQMFNVGEDWCVQRLVRTRTRARALCSRARAQSGL